MQLSVTMCAHHDLKKYNIRRCNREDVTGSGEDKQGRHPKEGGGGKGRRAMGRRDRDDGA